MVEVSTKALLLAKREDREYSFICNNSANLGEVYDVLREMTGFIVERVNEAERAQKPETPKAEVQNVESGT